MADIPFRLSEQLSKRRVVPFIGAGFSVPSGASLWSDLIRALIANTVPEKLTGHGDLLAQLSQPDLADVVDSLSVSSAAATQFLVDRINSERLEVHEYHRLLLDLQCPVIVTTNWDTLIEREHAERKRPCNVVYRESDVAMFDPSRRTQLLKIHGTISDPASLVYRKSDYSRFWNDRPLLLSLLTTLAATHSFLFIGYGFGDPNVLDLLEKLRVALAGGGQEHYALSYGENRLAWEFSRRNVTIVKAPDAKDSEGKVNYESQTLQFLRDLGHHAKTFVASNLERARLINTEIERLITRFPVRPALRMRGSLGWLSNPAPVKDDPIYGSYEQDVEERRMTELVTRFLDTISNSSVRCILHLAAAPLAGAYRAAHIRRRFEQIRAMVLAYPTRIAVVHDELPSYSNHMFFDEDALVLGFKAHSEGGINRVVLVRDSVTVRAEVEQFELDFATHLDANRRRAEQRGIDVTAGTWQSAFVALLITEELQRLDDAAASVKTSGEAPFVELAEALAFAILTHASVGQTREDGRTPYGVHLLRVVDRLRIVADVTDEQVLIAAALHDVVEDCGVTVPEITTRWGSRVSECVEVLTQLEHEPTADYIDRLRRASPDVKAIKLADRWDNVYDARTFARPTFGGQSLASYFEESVRVLDACKDGNAKLATRLHDDLALARLGSDV